MKKDQNKRLLGAMEFIDDKLIDRAAEVFCSDPFSYYYTLLF